MAKGLVIALVVVFVAIAAAFVVFCMLAGPDGDRDHGDTGTEP